MVEPSRAWQLGDLPELQVNGLDHEPMRNHLPVACPACALVGSRAGGAAFQQGEVGYLDQEVLVWAPRGTEAVAVLPRTHVVSLAVLPPPALGRTLAALRRASGWAQDQLSAPAIRIEETSGPPAADGHVCLLLVPAVPDEA